MASTREVRKDPARPHGLLFSTMSPRAASAKSPRPAVAPLLERRPLRPDFDLKFDVLEVSRRSEEVRPSTSPGVVVATESALQPLWSTQYSEPLIDTGNGTDIDGRAHAIR